MGPERRRGGLIQRQPGCLTALPIGVSFYLAGPGCLARPADAGPVAFKACSRPLARLATSQCQGSRMARRMMQWDRHVGARITSSLAAAHAAADGLLLSTEPMRFQQFITLTVQLTAMCDSLTPRLSTAVTVLAPGEGASVSASGYCTGRDRFLSTATLACSSSARRSSRASNT